MRAAPLALACLLAVASAAPGLAGTLILEPVAVTEFKAVYGRVEARNTVPARARTGGTLVALEVTEGDTVTAGQRIGTVRDDKIVFQVNALDAQLRALQAQLENAEADLGRGQQLVDRGVATAQRLDALRTQADVVRNQIAATEAQRQVVLQQGSEGEVLAPADGRVLTVPVTRGAVVMPGEAIATLGGGGIFLRLALPERHAGLLKEGASLTVEAGLDTVDGTLAKVYPQIENGRVVADVDVEGLSTDFVDARVLVRVPIGTRDVLKVPRAAVVTRSGLDFVRVAADGGESDRLVILGEAVGDDVEVVSGLMAGETVVTP